MGNILDLKTFIQIFPLKTDQSISIEFLMESICSETLI